MNLDTPSGRLLVATCSKAQIDAVAELMVSAYAEGWNAGAKAAFKLVQELIDDEGIDKTVEEMQKAVKTFTEAI